VINSAWLCYRGKWRRWRVEKRNEKKDSQEREVQCGKLH